MLTRSRTHGCVLLVESDPSLCRTLTHLLQGEGHAVESVHDGQAALTALKSHPLPDVIVMEPRLPGMDGWEFRRCQLQDPRIASIPVVVLTAGRDTVASASQLQAAAYLTRPFSAPSLLDTIADLIRNRREVAPHAVESALAGATRSPRSTPLH
jgi:CheY-like chemotaxis protein